jgi:hypothetical protein
MHPQRHAGLRHKGIEVAGIAGAEKGCGLS